MKHGGALVKLGDTTQCSKLPPSDNQHTYLCVSFVLWSDLCITVVLFLLFLSGCSVFENCKRCNNGTWGPRDDFFVSGRYCSECRPGWSGGDCMSKIIHIPYSRQLFLNLQLWQTNLCLLTFNSANEPDHECRHL